MKTDDPYLDAGLVGWMVNTARKHYWKVASHYEFEDLIQDGYLCFAKARKGFKYTMEVPDHDNRKMFMAFFQMAFINHITDLQKDPRSQRQELVAADLSEDQSKAVESWASSASELGNASLSLMLAQAPAEILEILKLILIDGAAEVPYLKTRLRKKVLPNGVTPRMVRGKRAIRETTEQHYDRCLGRKGVVAQLRNYLLGQEPDLLDRLVNCLFTENEQDGPSMVQNEREFSRGGVVP
jgi:hypothetical protein